MNPQEHPHQGSEELPELVATRWAFRIAYEGTDFTGWQSQTTGDAIQDRIETRLAELTGGPVRIHGSGRTDAGVHAAAQVAHTDLRWEHGVEKLRIALQSGLPETLQILDCATVVPDFHARYSACGKTYHYRLHNLQAPVDQVRFVHSLGGRFYDWERIGEAASLLLGTHDFSAFGARSEGRIEGNPVKEMRRIDLIERPDGGLELQLEASGFLYKMARSLVGTLLEVGRGKLSLADVAELLRTKERDHRVPTAPARGLSLIRVDYPDGLRPDWYHV